MRDSSYLLDATALNLTANSKTEDQKRHKANIAAKKRARLMEKMCKMQRDFIKENAALFESASEELPTESSEELMR